MAVWDVLTYLWDVLISVFGPIIKFITEVAEILTSEEGGKFGKLFKSLGKNLWDLIKGLWLSIVNYFTTIIKIYGERAIPIIIDALQFVFGFVFQAVLGLIPLALDYVIGYITKVLDILFNGWGTKIAQAITGKEGNVHIFQALWDKIMGAFTALFDGIGNVWLWIVDFFHTIVDFFKDFSFKNLGAKLKEWLSQGWEGIKGALSSVVNFFSDIIQMFTRFVDAAFGTNWTAGFQGFVQKIVEFIQTGKIDWSAVVAGFASKIIEKIKERFELIGKIFNFIITVAKIIGGKILEDLRERFEFIGKIFNFIITVAKIIGGKILEDLKKRFEFIGKIFSFIVEVAKIVGGKALQKFITFFNNLKKGL